MAGGNAARTNGCDFIVALGGGSVMDASKAIAVMATNDGDYWDYIPSGSGKGKIITNVPLPIIAITTTAGTGRKPTPAASLRMKQLMRRQALYILLYFPFSQLSILN